MLNILTVVIGSEIFTSPSSTANKATPDEMFPQLPLQSITGSLIETCPKL